MAAGYLPRPGSKYGPCALGEDGEYPACGHMDCAETYGMANARCHYCGKRIGYEVGFYQEWHDFKRQLVHALCAEEDASNT